MPLPAPQDHLVAELPALMACARALTRNDAQAEDLVQDCLVTALRQGDKLRDPERLKPWLMAILRNRFRSDWRRRKHRELSLDESAGTDIAALGCPDDHILLADLRRALAHLPASEREAIALVSAAGLTYDEAAQATGTPVGTVKARVSRGRARLSRILAA